MSDDSNSSEDKSMITKILGRMKTEFNNESTTNEDLNGFDIKAEEVEKIEPEAPDMSDNNLNNSTIKRKPSSPRKRTNKSKIVLDTSVKRSTRRRSRDYSESILQSAIARKEKSYNETNKPQRLSRQLKPTQKILENIANAAALKQDKKKDKSKINGVGDKNKSNNLKTKGGKRIKINHCLDVVAKKVNTSGKNNRRKDRKLNNVEKAITEEPVIEDINMEDKLKELEASAQLITSICVCSNKTNYFLKSDTSNVFCEAIDSIDNKLIGCSNLVDIEQTSLVRPSTRIPYKLLCKVHYNRMTKHNCCPTCGVFCTQGSFAQCVNNHQYHRACQISVSDFNCCPHCSSATPKHDISITIKTPLLPKLYSKQKLHVSCLFKCNTFKSKDTLFV